jgi:hypothetical protein
MLTPVRDGVALELSGRTAEGSAHAFEIERPSAEIHIERA